MITIYRENGAVGDVQELELRGLSTDTKPTTLNDKPVQNGTIFLEMDTGKIYMYDQENEQWREL